MTVHIGTSGWVYRHWRRIFYPKELHQDDWFAYYASLFDTVEINYSFYRLPSADAFTAWRERAPSGFIFAVKASRFLTHLKKLKDPEAAIHNLFERASLLGEHLGPVLYQLPPNWQVNLERFERFLVALPKGYTHVVELRDESWLIEEVFRLMERYRVTLCIHDLHSIRIPIRVTAPTVYIRFHGDAHHAGDYSDATLETWAERIRAWHREGFDAFVYFNNDVGGYAPKNAMTLKTLLFTS